MPPRLIAVVGATATGKTSLGVELAKALDGEVINADSRQIYRGMDIGTAKPTAADRVHVPHHLLDIASPDETVTLADFLDLARAAIADIYERSRLPIVVGGTGQYVWALLEGWRVPRVPPDLELRAALERTAETGGPSVLAGELRALDPVSAATIDPRNVRRVIRAIEVTRATGRPFSQWQERDAPTFESSIVGLKMPRADLYERIDARVDAMMKRGFLEEVRHLREQYSCEVPAMSGIGYKELCEFLASATTHERAVAAIKTSTHRLARMQATWFKNADQRIHWYDPRSPTLVADVLQRVSASAGGALS